MHMIFLFLAIIFIASVLQTSTGFGFSIVATPFLLLIFDPGEAIQINLILSFVISAILIQKILKDIDKGILKRFIYGSSIGLILGIVIFLIINMTILKLGVSMLILILTGLLILKFNIKQTKLRDTVVGGFSGMLTSSIGMPGPPLLLYLSGTSTQKEKLRGTTLAFYLFIYFFSLILQICLTGTDQTVWLSASLALPVVLVGLVTGQWMFKWINQRLFQVISYIILMFTGLYLLINNL